MADLNDRRRNQRVAKIAKRWAPLVSDRAEKQSPSFARKQNGTPRRDVQPAPKKRPSIMNKLYTSNQHQHFVLNNNKM